GGRGGRGCEGSGVRAPGAWGGAAETRPTLGSVAVGVAVAVAASGTFSGAIALGGAAVTNTSATVAAAGVVNGSTITAPGGLTLTATDHAVITAVPVAASLSFSFGDGAVSIAFSGAVPF